MDSGYRKKSFSDFSFEDTHREMYSSYLFPDLFDKKKHLDVIRKRVQKGIRDSESSIKEIDMKYKMRIGVLNSKLKIARSTSRQPVKTPKVEEIFSFKKKPDVSKSTNSGVQQVQFKQLRPGRRPVRPSSSQPNLLLPLMASIFSNIMMALAIQKLSAK